MQFANKLNPILAFCVILFSLVACGSKNSTQRLQTTGVAGDQNATGQLKLTITDAGFQRPNIILVMADDLGWGDVSYQAQTPIQTPELDEMAANSLVFSRYYAAAPVCSPTRGSFMTGRHPNRYGIPTANRGHLLADEITLAELVKEKDYRTGHFGKWHLGTLSKEYSTKGKRRDPANNFMTPGMAGFDEWFATESAIATYDPYNHDRMRGTGPDGKYTEWRAGFYRNGEPLTEAVSGPAAKIVMDEALSFIEKSAASETPFMAVIWLHPPHNPIIGDPEVMARLYAEHGNAYRHYYSAVSSVDTSMGVLRKRLRELGIENSTLVAFSSDNGPEGNPSAAGRNQGSTVDLRGRKRSLYEGGVRVPGIIEWPGRIDKARVTAMPVVSSDLFPTIADIIGAPMPKNRPYDGESLLDVIDGAERSRLAPIGFSYLGYETWMSDRYKLVHNIPGKRDVADTSSLPVSEWELYDIVTDSGETKNIAGKHKDIVAGMQTELSVWRASVERSSTGADY